MPQTTLNTSNYRKMGHDVKMIYSWCCYSQGYVWQSLIGHPPPGLWTGASRNGTRSVDEIEKTVNKTNKLRQRDGQRGKKKAHLWPRLATQAIRQAFLDCWRIRSYSYRAVVHRVASPAHDIQDVVCSVQLAVNAVEDGVVCIEDTQGRLQMHNIYELKRLKCIFCL